MPKRVFILDGTRFSTLDGFYDEVSRVLVPGAKWGRNLDAFNDILRGGFGTPAGGFVLRWTHAGRSRRTLPRFGTLVEIIRVHGAGGAEAGDGVELELA
ncbi:MAG: barstar family protein [Planctomycetia bacterium]|nr:barstar family protein [Planctomycetia bacterium]